jgi:hypothetical protein
VVAVDGKSLHGTYLCTGGSGVHLLESFTHCSGTVAGQPQILLGTSEIAAIEPLLDTINLDGAVPMPCTPPNLTPATCIRHQAV